MEVEDLEEKSENLKSFVVGYFNNHGEFERFEFPSGYAVLYDPEKKFMVDGYLEYAKEKHPDKNWQVVYLDAGEKDVNYWNPVTRKIKWSNTTTNSIYSNGKDFVMLVEFNQTCYDSQMSQTHTIITMDGRTLPWFELELPNSEITLLKYLNSKGYKREMPLIDLVEFYRYYRNPL